MTKKQWSAEEKQKIVLARLRNEASVAELCRRHGVSDVLYYKWKKIFLDSGLNALKCNGKVSSAEAALKRENEDLKALIGELTVENRFLKKNTKLIKDYQMIETMREEEKLSISKACHILGLSRTEYYQKVFGMSDYHKKGVKTKDIEPHKKQAIERISLEEPEYGHKKIWALLKYRHEIEITKYETYKIMKTPGLLLPSKCTKQLREQMQGRQQYLHKP